MPHSTLIPLPLPLISANLSESLEPTVQFCSFPAFLHPRLICVSGSLCLSLSLSMCVVTCWPGTVHISSFLLPPAVPSSMSSRMSETCGSPRELPIELRDYATERLAVRSLGTGQDRRDRWLVFSGGWIPVTGRALAHQPAFIILLGSITFALLEHWLTELNEINAETCGAGLLPWFIFLPIQSTFWKPENMRSFNQPRSARTHTCTHVHNTKFLLCC